MPIERMGLDIKLIIFRIRARYHSCLSHFGNVNMWRTIHDAGVVEV